MIASGVVFKKSGATSYGGIQGFEDQGNGSVYIPQTTSRFVHPSATLDIARYHGSALPTPGPNAQLPGLRPPVRRQPIKTRGPSRTERVHEREISLPPGRFAGLPRALGPHLGRSSRPVPRRGFPSLEGFPSSPRRPPAPKKSARASGEGGTRDGGGEINGAGSRPAWGDLRPRVFLTRATGAADRVA